ncbi:MAG: polymerase sigma factor [Sphingomonas bacterium]|uniref:RNA polymerase sigma factor n=1 Tax=Sphingomonas bacterium TaxID=1895847 RepID=UPI00262BE7AF|nr:sigma-70 family RNA polymerase sigma factor [Sphingomonas bacterium]MDB5706815.1 polymerase sigma factor [Sphingomonas bacterium]
MSPTLDRAARDHGARVRAALAARFRDLDVAEEAFAEACARAVTAWASETPRDPAAWLYRVAERAALDTVRRRAVRADATLPETEPPPTPEDAIMADSRLIPDERLRLIFICCHPAIHPDARAALTLKLVCGLSTAEIARAFLVPEPTLAQRLVRAKNKIAGAGVPFEVPGPDAWPARLDAVLSTIEIAYAKAHEDGGGSGRHAGYAREMLGITATLATLAPEEPEVLALAATVRFAEARRPARVDAGGVMVPLDRQDPGAWDAALIAEGRGYLARALMTAPPGARTLQALIHAEWCVRPSLDAPAPWPSVLALYDGLLAHRDNAVTRLNRAVALAEICGVEAALEEVDALDAPGLADFLPYHAVRADLLARLGLKDAAREAYDAALRLGPEQAERRWMEGRRAQM